MRGKIVTFLTLVAFCLFAEIGLAQSLTVKLDPASVDLTATGATFDIKVMIEDVTDLGGFQFSINYNPTIVTVNNSTDVVLGSFLGSTGRSSTPVGPNIDNVAGKVTYGAFTMGAAPPGPSGNGLLATITFTVQSQVNGLLDLNAVQITDIAGVPITINTVGNSTLIGGAPAVTLNPTTLAFGNQTLGTTSAPQTVTLTNSGNAMLNITGITGSGDFAVTNTCSATLAAGANCTINATFSPTIEGNRTGQITVTSDAASSPDSAALTGTGTVAPMPAVTLNPTSLAFGNQTLGTTSAPQTVTLTNSGNAMLNITGITGSGDFAVTNTCSATLAAGANCTINATFSPTIEGNRTGQITVTSDAASSPDSAALTGTGTVAPMPAVTLNPTSLAFGNQTLGTTSAPQTVTLTNSGNAMLNITGITGSGDFAVTNTCGATLAAGANCTINATFSPTIEGNRTGQITVTSDAASSPDSVALSGVGGNTPIPTLSEWGMIIFALLMGSSGLYLMKKKNAFRLHA